MLADQHLEIILAEKQGRVMQGVDYFQGKRAAAELWYVPLYYFCWNAIGPKIHHLI